MRLTTGTATLALAGLAALATGCSSSSPAAQAPIQHHVVKPISVTNAAKPLSAKQQLAQAMRASLAAHTALARARETVIWKTAPKAGEDVNPILVIGTVVDFDHNRTMQVDGAAPHAAQPGWAQGVTLTDGRNVYAGKAATVVNSGLWTKGAAGSCDNADSLVDVLSDTYGPIGVRKNVGLNGESGQTLYTVKFHFGPKGDCKNSPGSSDFGVQQVWVDGEGRIAQIRYYLHAGAIATPHVAASKVKGEVLTVEFSNYGVSMVIPQHPTVKAAG